MGSQIFSNLKTNLDVQVLFWEFMTGYNSYEFEGNFNCSTRQNCKTVFVLYEIIAVI